MGLFIFSVFCLLQAYIYKFIDNNVHYYIQQTIFQYIVLFLNVYTYYFNCFFSLYIVISLEISHYIVDTFYKLKKKEYEFVVHHIVCIAITIICIYANYYQLMIHVFFWFSISTPFLSLSKLLHYLNFEMSAKICFYLFSGLFFITRILCGGALMIYIYFVTNNITFITSSILYSLQIFWSFKIVQFIKKVN